MFRKLKTSVSGDYVGSDKDGNLYKGIVVFMIQGLKQSIPVVIKACPEVTIKGEWLANEVDDDDCIITTTIITARFQCSSRSN